MNPSRIALCALVVGACERSGAEADRRFDTSVSTPAYAANGPVVLFDEAHRNIHRANGTYAPFADLIRNDGYRVRRNRDVFSRATLDAADLVVIANALGANERNDDDALSEAECDALIAWIREGGGLLLITDHYATGSAVGNLAGRLGVSMSGGVTEDSVSYDKRFDRSHIVFENLPAHQITRGVNRVLTFTGVMHWLSRHEPAGGVTGFSAYSSSTRSPSHRQFFYRRERRGPALQRL